MAPVTEPDLAGFRDAQKRLRAGFGEDVLFLGEVTATFPPDAAINPESGTPYDPTIEAVASAQASAVVRCNVVKHPAREDGSPDQGGWFELGHIVLIADLEDRAAIEGKAHAELHGQRYLIVSSKPDGIAGLDRILVACRLEDAEA